MSLLFRFETTPGVEQLRLVVSALGIEFYRLRRLSVPCRQPPRVSLERVGEREKLRRLRHRLSGPVARQRLRLDIGFPTKVRLA